MSYPTATIARDHWTEAFDSYAGWTVTITDPAGRTEEPVTFADVDHDYDAYDSYEHAADYAEQRIFFVTESNP